MGKRRYYVGLDLSLTGSAVVLTSKDKKETITSLIKSRVSDSMEDRLVYIAEEILIILNTYRKEIKCIALEGLALHAKGQRLAQISALHYYVRIRLQKRFKKYIQIIAPTELKKFVTGKGNSKKNLMLLHAYKNWRFETNDDNICDAYCLTRYARKITKK